MGKSQKKDGFSIETIRALGERNFDIFHVICNRIWLTGKWAHTVFAPLHNKITTLRYADDGTLFASNAGLMEE
ncbi:unnamed protein product [Arctia plantaginis]|uniref:Uncharacterized protein n=1 Tax=Arctia plantaginis TaxID=874455 RepID=A0A8S0Z040_ARCPL|nr:unnamed protein product [Arctia plantaginis]